MTLRYVRFTIKDAPVGTVPRYGVIKPFHFSAGGEEQIMVLDGTPYEHDFEAPHPTDETLPLTAIRLFAPVTPSKIIGIGLNYRDHAKERGKPLPETPYVFLKAPSSVCGPGETIRIGRHCTEVEHEAELAVVIGAECSDVGEPEAAQCVIGYTIANDVTDRAIQRAEPTFARAKSMDTFCPLGPWLTRGVGWQGRRVRSWVNGELRQSGTTDDMIHSVPAVVSYVSKFMTLYPGDLILTGTPSGVGPLRAGDAVKIEIEGLGSLENGVENAF